MARGEPVTLVHVTTVPETLRFLSEQPRYMAAHGIRTVAVSSPGPMLDAFGRAEGVPVRQVKMRRRITPAADLLALAELVRLFRELRPRIVHAHTPKAALLGMLAAASCRVPVRIYQMRGMPVLTARGSMRLLLASAERLTCALATRVICQSASLREIALAERYAPAHKVTVLGPGSNGVDLNRFDPMRLAPQGARRREELRLGRDDFVFGYVGRLVSDKGIRELAQAWREVRSKLPRAKVLVVGDWEERDPVPPTVRRALESDDTVRMVPFTEVVAEYYSAMDVVLLPTYREGFPNVPLEAAAMGLPVIATRIPGCIEAVEDGVTGTLIPSRDAVLLRDAMLSYGLDAELRSRHGQAARARVERKFSRKVMIELIAREYARLLSISSISLRDKLPTL